VKQTTIQAATSHDTSTHLFIFNFARRGAVMFLPRDAMLQRGLCCRAVPERLYTCPSVRRFVHCVETAKDTAVVTTECEQETLRKLSSGTIFNDLQ